MGIYNLAGQPVPVSHHSHSKEFIPNNLSKSTCFHFKAISPHPVTACPYKKSLPSFPVGPFGLLEGCDKVPPELFLFQAEEPQLSQPVLGGEVLQPSDQLCGPPLDPLQQLHVLPVLGPPEVDSVLQLGSHKSRVKGHKCLLFPATVC